MYICVYQTALISKSQSAVFPQLQSEVAMAMVAAVSVPAQTVHFIDIKAAALLSL